MGSAQSRARWNLQCLFPASSDYAHLSSSSSKQHLLIDGALNKETAIRGIPAEATTNAKKVVNLEYKIERLVSKNMAMEENIRKCSADKKKVIELERTIQGLLSKNSLMEKKISKLESKIELLGKLHTTGETNPKEIIGDKRKGTEINLDKEFDRIEKLLLSETEATEGNIRKLRANADGQVLVPSSQINMDEELDKGVEEPEYVNHIKGLILMLIFVVFVLIGMQL